MDKAEEITHRFPLAGEDTSQAFDEQPNRPILQGADYARTTIKAVNVRAQDPLIGELRGGSRTGLEKYIPSQPNGFGLIQDLDVIVWTSPGAVGSGGGYQPAVPLPSSTQSFTMQVGYVLTASGFQIAVRLVQSAPLARTSSLTASLSILDPVVAPLSDFASAANGYQAQIAVLDQNGQPVQINLVPGIIQPLRMNLGAADVVFLGLPATTINWTQTYSSDPGTTTYTVTVTLLDASGTPVAALDGSGNPTGGNVDESFSTAPLTATEYLPLVVYIGLPFQIAVCIDETYPTASNAITVGGTATAPALLTPPTASFWSVATSGTGPGGYSLGTINTNGATVNKFTGASLVSQPGWGLTNGVYVAPNITLTSSGDAIALTDQPSGCDFNFQLGVYAGYFSSTTAMANLYSAIAALAKYISGGGT